MGVRIRLTRLDSAPAGREICIHETTATEGVVETRETEGFRFHAMVLDSPGASGRIAGQLPANPHPALADFPLYRWDGWQQPDYRLALKDSYQVLKDALRKIEE